MNMPPNDWNRIRRFYRIATPVILAERRDEWAIDAYAWDLGMIWMTPIEYWLWADLRNCSAIVYPQYPVGRYFVDFANPVARVAIECDGAAYHVDKARDAQRQRDIESLGWTVHRISGRDCRTDFDEETMQPSRAHEFVRRVCDEHGISRNCSQTAVDDGDLLAWSTLEIDIEQLMAGFTLRARLAAV